MSKLVNLTMFRGYVNKVLPTVYDDSLSYYEVLAKVMEKINEIINLDNAQNEIINNIPEDVSEFAEDLAQFKSTMTQQFNEFKTEINADFDAFEAEVNAKIAADTTPTQGSTKLITSGGVYASLQDIINSLVKDAHPTKDSENYVTSGGVWAAINDAVEDLEATLDTKQNVLTWDTTPTANSTNPVQSGGIKTYVDNAKQTALDNLNNYITTNNSRVSGIEGDITDLETGKQDALTFDLAPTLGSINPVTSNGIAQAIAGITPSIDVDPAPTQGSTNPVSSNGVFVAVSGLETELEEGLSDKQDSLTFDVMPTQNSLNPVTSGGVWQALSQIDPTGTIDPEPTQGSTAAVSSGGTWSALQQLDSELSADIATKQNALTFDNTPTINSGNPVTSDGIYRALQEKQSALTFDSTPTQYSTNPVTSGGVYDAIQGGGGGGTIDPTPTQGSTNAVSSGGVYTALQGKQNTLTFDNTPTQNSLNPVTSGGIWAAIQGGGGGGDVSTADLMQQSAYAMLSAGTATSSYANSGSNNGLYPDWNWQYASGTPNVSKDLTRFSNIYGENGLLYWLHNDYLTNYAYENNSGQLDFIKVGDYFQFTNSEDYTFTMRVAGIDTYYNMGDPTNNLSVGHHIDFISDELYPTAHVFNTGANGTGTSLIPEPWLASDLYFWLNSLAGTTPYQTVDYTQTGIFNTLPAEIANNISEKIAALVQKTGNDPSNVSFKSMGKLWIPTECEILGSGNMGRHPYTNEGQIQYPLFTHSGANYVKMANGTRHKYWLQAYRDQSTTVLYMNEVGFIFNVAANSADAYFPICFRVDITNY